MKKESNPPPPPGMIRPAPPPRPPDPPVTSNALHISPIEVSEADLNKAKELLKHVIELREELARIMGVPERFLKR